MPESNELRIQQKVDEVKKRFEERIAKIQEDGSERIKQIGDDSPEPSAFEAGINATFDVKWKDTSIKFDIPKFTMEKETIKFDVPEVKMELKVMKFDVPATRMVRTCLFKKPEVTVSGFPPKVTTRMTCVYGDKPEVYMKTIEIKTDIPKFTSKRIEITFDKPVVKMETTEIKLRLPQFFVKQVSGELRDQQRDIETVGQDMTANISVAENEMKRTLQTEVAAELEKINGEMRAQLLTERNNVSSYYDDAIAKTKSTIKILKENNANDEVGRLETELSKLVSDYDKILADIDKGLEEMNASLTEAMNGLKVA